MRTIRYLNTDLDLVSEERPTDLLAGLRAGGAYALYRPVRGEDGLWHVTLEHEDVWDTPEATIGLLLDAIEGLSAARRRAWRACRVREFNIGYDSGFKPWAFNNGLSNRTLRRIGKVGATLRITIYPPEKVGGWEKGKRFSGMRLRGPD